MIINGPFYQLIPVNDSANKYDFYLLKDIGGKNPRQELKVEAYAITLEYAIHRIIDYAVRKKFGEEAIVDIKEFLDEYKRTRDEIVKDLGIRKG